MSSGKTEKKEGVNTFRTHYEENLGNILAQSFSTIQKLVEEREEDMVPVGDFRRARDDIFGEDQNSVIWRSLSDLYDAGVIDTEKQGDTNYIVPQTDSIDETVLEQVKTPEEYRESLVHHDTQSVTLEDDWLEYDVDGETVTLPRFPVEFFEEHFERHGYDTGVFTQTDDDNEPVAQMLVAEDDSTWGDLERKSYVFNQREEENDFIKLAVEVYKPENLADTFFSDRNTMNWLSRVKDQELEPLIGDIENIYQQAYDAATGQHEVFSDEVEDLRDVRDALNSQSQRKNMLSIADVIDRSRESNEYFGDSGADRLRGPLAEYLNFGRNGSVAPVSAQYSDNKREAGKVDRGELMEDMYFNALESFAEELYDDFDEVPE